MNVDFQYPALSSIAKTQGFTLQQLAENACLQSDKLLRLCDCCQMARDDYPHWRVDHYHYLATIDEFIKKLQGNDHAQMMIWQKLVSDKLFRKTPSIFLDTVAEAAWAIHFINGGWQIKLEVPFQNKNADIVLVIKGKEFWLDVINVELHHIHRSKEGIISAIAKRAIKKYTNKFKKAVLSGPLQGASTGILLCFLKSEKYVVPPLLIDYLHGAELPPPPELFSSKNIGLDMVWGHTLTSLHDKEYLQPEPLIKWFR
jgi:hypothetical protein